MRLRHMTTNTANIKAPKLENMTPADALDFALIAGKVWYVKRLALVGVTMDDLDALKTPWLKLPVDYTDDGFIYNLLDDGATIRKDTGLTDAEIIEQIKDALKAFMDAVDDLATRGRQ